MSLTPSKKRFATTSTDDISGNRDFSSHTTSATALGTLPKMAYLLSSIYGLTISHSKSSIIGLRLSTTSRLFEPAVAIIDAKFNGPIFDASSWDIFVKHINELVEVFELPDSEYRAHEHDIFTYRGFKISFAYMTTENGRSRIMDVTSTADEPMDSGIIGDNETSLRAKRLRKGSPHRTVIMKRTVQNIQTLDSLVNAKLAYLVLLVPSANICKLHLITYMRDQLPVFKQSIETGEVSVGMLENYVHSFSERDVVQKHVVDVMNANDGTHTHQCYKIILHELLNIFEKYVIHCIIE